MIDLHCHILPGLDDGAGSLEDALAMARAAQADGIKTIVATPHLFRGNLSTDDFGAIKERRRELAEELAKSGVPVELKAGAEVHISHDLIAEIGSHRGDLVINGSAYMFIEFPSSHIYPGVKNLVFELMSEGIVPIIAHPERNLVLARQPGLLYDIVRLGALAQANGGSLTGLYGREAGEAVVQLLKWNLIHFLASDAHNASSMPPRLSRAVERAEAAAGKDGARALVFDNPRAVLEDRDLPFLPPPVDPRKSKKSLSFRIPGFLRRFKPENS
ncbi:MAG: CpsB/CapC family capsule biosynthesis tyrosine phosphatase [Candidatus Aminicenantales bacterium]